MSRREVYGTKAWRRVRRYVIDRDGYKCRQCGRTGRLEVHHRNPMWRSSANPFDPAGLETLCRPCLFGSHGQTLKAAPAGAAEWKAFIR